MFNVYPGPVPKLVGICFIKEWWKWDNSFWGMLPWDLLYVKSENRVYPDALAYKYYAWDHDGCNGPNPAEAREWTFLAPQGMSWTITAYKDLLKVIVMSANDRQERFEAWLMLHHSMLVSQSFALSQCDHTMMWVANHLPSMHRPGRWVVFD